MFTLGFFKIKRMPLFQDGKRCTPCTHLFSNCPSLRKLRKKNLAYMFLIILHFIQNLKNVFFIVEPLFLSSFRWEISLFQLLLLYRSLPVHRDEILLRFSASLAKSSFCTLLLQSGQTRGGVERDLWTGQSRLWHGRRTKGYAHPTFPPTPSDSPGTHKCDQTTTWKFWNNTVFFVVKYKIRSWQIKKITAILYCTLIFQCR